MYLKHGLPERYLPADRIANKIFNIKYSLCRPSGEQKESMLGRIRQTLKEKEKIPGAYAHTVYEDWDVKEKFAKFIVNSCNVYSWFGFEYRLPFWDKEFVEFFRKVPFADKVNKKLYDEVLVNRIFRPAGLLFGKEVQPPAAVQKLAYLKSVIRKNLPFRSGRAMKNDPLFYREITQMMVDDLKGKGKDIRIEGKAYNSLIVQWYLHQLYEH
jgi:asparagine synthase (glutamine-hydrolysing)